VLYKDFMKEFKTESPRNVSEVQTKAPGKEGHLIPK
jgi:hypothetical protein